MVEQKPISTDDIRRYLETRDSLRDYRLEIASLPTSITFTLRSNGDVLPFKLALEKQLKEDDPKAAAEMHIYESTLYPGDIDIDEHSIQAFRLIIHNYLLAESRAKVQAENETRRVEVKIGGREGKESQEKKKASQFNVQQIKQDLERYNNWKSVINTLFERINRDTKDFPGVFLTYKQLQTLENFKTELEKAYLRFCEAHQRYISSVGSLNDDFIADYKAFLSRYQEESSKLNRAIEIENSRVKIEEQQKRDRLELGTQASAEGEFEETTGFDVRSTT